MACSRPSPQVNCFGVLVFVSPPAPFEYFE
jgi:hypothetical protein